MGIKFLLDAFPAFEIVWIMGDTGNQTGNTPVKPRGIRALELLRAPHEEGIRGCPVMFGLVEVHDAIVSSEFDRREKGVFATAFQDIVALVVVDDTEIVKLVAYVPEFPREMVS